MRLAEIAGAEAVLLAWVLGAGTAASLIPDLAARAWQRITNRRNP